MKVLAIFGTRPEAIKRTPPLRAWKAQSGLECIAALIGQHWQMLDQVLHLLGIQADHDLDVMVPKQTLDGLYARVLTRVDALLEGEAPDCVLVRGDTTTAQGAPLMGRTVQEFNPIRS